MPRCTEPEIDYRSRIAALGRLEPHVRQMFLDSLKTTFLPQERPPPRPPTSGQAFRGFMCLKGCSSSGDVGA
jgi:hypothetical protein